MQISGGSVTSLNRSHCDRTALIDVTAMAGLEKPSIPETGKDGDSWPAVESTERDTGQGEHSQRTEYGKSCPGVTGKVSYRLSCATHAVVHLFLSCDALLTSAVYAMAILTVCLCVALMECVKMMESYRRGFFTTQSLTILVFSYQTWQISDKITLKPSMRAVNTDAALGMRVYFLYSCNAFCSDTFVYFADMWWSDLALYLSFWFFINGPVSLCSYFRLNWTLKNTPLCRLNQGLVCFVS